MVKEKRVTAEQPQERDNMEKEGEARTKQVCNKSRRPEAKEKTGRASRGQRESWVHSCLGHRGLTTHTGEVGATDKSRAHAVGQQQTQVNSCGHKNSLH